MPTAVIMGTSASLPTPGPIASTPDIASIAVDGGTAPASETIATGTLQTDLTPAVNDHAARLDISMMALIGLPCIIRGLILSDGGGLIVGISAGQGFIHGIVELAAQTKVLADNATNIVYVDTAGSVHVVVTPVPADCLYLGSVVTLAGVITSIPIGGVFSQPGGLPIRYTTDAGKPGDTPTTTAQFLTKGLGNGTVAGGTWFWDGQRYLRLNQAGRVALSSTFATVVVNAALGDVFEILATQNITFAAPTNPEEGKRVRFFVKQGGSGSYTIAWNAIYLFGTISVTPSTTVGKVDIYEFEYSTFVGGWVLTNFQKGY